MLLIPFEKKDSPEITRRSELDEQMAKILKRDDLDDRDKFRMYQRLLEFYLRISKDGTLEQDTYLNNAGKSEVVDNQSISNNNSNQSISNNSSNRSISSNSSNQSISNNVSQNYQGDFDEFDENDVTKNYTKEDHLAHINKYYKTAIDVSLNQSQAPYISKVPKRVHELHLEDHKYRPINVSQQPIYDYNEPSPVKPFELRKSTNNQEPLTSYEHNKLIQNENKNTKLNNDFNTSNDNWSKKLFPTPDKTQLELTALDQTLINTPIIDNKFITNRDKNRGKSLADPLLPDWEEYKSKSKIKKDKHLAKIEEEKLNYYSSNRKNKQKKYKDNSRRTLNY